MTARLRPYLTRESAPEQVDLHATTAMEVFLAKFKLALLCGLILNAPIIVYQAWTSIAAGLTPPERKRVLRYVPLAIMLFFAGVAFAYFVTMPIALLLLPSVDPEIKLVLMYGPYLSLVITAICMLAMAFQLPLVLMVLARCGMVSAKTLTDKRWHAILLMFVVDPA